MRAPPESLSPMTGAPFSTARSMTLQILRGVGLRQRPAEDREVLGEEVDQPAVDRAVAADHTVAGNQLLLHPEVTAAVGDQRIDLDKGAGIEQQLDALASR